MAYVFHVRKCQPTTCKSVNFFNGAHGLFEELSQHAGKEIDFWDALIVRPVKSQRQHLDNLKQELLANTFEPFFCTLHYFDKMVQCILARSKTRDGTVINNDCRSCFNRVAISDMDAVGQVSGLM